MNIIMIDEFEDEFINSPDFKDRSDAAVNSEAVQLISKSQNGDLVVNDEALEIIKNINGKVAAFIVVGPYRQGKSYILNRLTDSSCFKVGHTDNSCTKGLWMSKNVLKQQNILKDEVNVIYLDTEGIESDDSNSEWDTKIFLSSLLISSMFCYNTKNALTSDAIKKLSVMSILSERVKLNSTDAIIDPSECPDFLWVVRDYSLRSTLTPIERLNKFLEEENTQNVGNSNVLNSIIERNKIRTRLKSSFFKMDCKYLPCPVTDGTNNMSLEEALQNMDDIKWEDLREPFRKGMAELCQLIKERIRPKIINKTNVNGRIFAAYIKEIVNKLNLNQTICLTESLIASIKLAAFEALEIVQLKYKNEMNRLVYPLDWDKFSYTEAQINDKCVRELKENIIGDNQILNQTLEKFSNFKQTLNEQLKEKNGKAIFEKAYNLANTIWTTKMNPKIASFKYSYEFNQFIQTLKIEFETNEFKSSKESHRPVQRKSQKYL